SSITIVFHFEREWGHYILDVYLSSTLIVIVSWLSFWMEISATPARVMLGMTTLLTFLTISKDARDDLPNNPYVSALDVSYSVCTGRSSPPLPCGSPSLTQSVRRLHIPESNRVRGNHIHIA